MRAGFMTIGMLGLVAAGPLCGQPRAEPAPGPGNIVVSSSKQFRVTGGNPMGRGLCVILAEDAKAEFLQLVEEPDAWKVPVTIMLHGEPGDKVPGTGMATRLMVVAGVHRLQLDMHLGEGLRIERFKQAITEMLVYERALKAVAGPDDGALLSVPPWLAVGLREASAWRMQQSDRRLYAAMFKQGGAYRVEEMLSVTRAQHGQMDEASSVAFRVSAGALVMALLEQPQGRKAFREFLDEAAAFQGEMPLLLRRHFPELNLSPNSLSKWWALQLAHQGGLNLLTDVMSISETEEQLARSLFLELPGADGDGQDVVRLAIDQWRELEKLKPEQRTAAVRPAQAALVHLSYRCFPSYRPLLVEYQKQLIRLAQGDDKVVGEALDELAEARRIMNEKSGRGRDYLDWFEITTARETSGVFDDYLRLKQQLKQREGRRNDPVSEYLDRMERVFEPGASGP